MRDGGRSGGFTLIEVLVAFTIAAILLVALLRSFSGGVAGSVRADDYTEATILAESTLEALGTSEALGDGFHFERAEGRYIVAATAHLYTPPDASDVAHRYVVAYDVRVTVSWHEGLRAPSITLRTLHLALRQ